MKILRMNRSILQKFKAFFGQFKNKLINFSKNVCIKSYLFFFIIYLNLKRFKYVWIETHKEVFKFTVSNTPEIFQDIIHDLKKLTKGFPWYVWIFWLLTLNISFFIVSLLIQHYLLGLFWYLNLFYIYKYICKYLYFKKKLQIKYKYVYLEWLWNINVLNKVINIYLLCLVDKCWRRAYLDFFFALKYTNLIYNTNWFKLLRFLQKQYRNDTKQFEFAQLLDKFFIVIFFSKILLIPLFVVYLNNKIIIELFVLWDFKYDTLMDYFCAVSYSVRDRFGRETAIIVKHIFIKIFNHKIIYFMNLK